MIVRKLRLTALILCLVALALSLAGCGRNGPLEAPNPAAKEETQPLPAGTRKPCQPEAEKPSAIPSPFVRRCSFVLDPLL